MKIFFDTNVYVAEALLGKVASRLIDATILQGALAAGVDYLVTNDRHLLGMNPYEGIIIMTMDAYQQFLFDQGLLAP